MLFPRLISAVRLLPLCLRFYLSLAMSPAALRAQEPRLRRSTSTPPAAPHSRHSRSPFI